MKKDAIKIIKRNKIGEAEKTEAAPATPNSAGVTQHGTINAVKIWISERRENSRAEKAFSDSKILSWESMSENLK
jgi:hypothetical protein